MIQSILCLIIGNVKHVECLLFSLQFLDQSYVELPNVPNHFSNFLMSSFNKKYYLFPQKLFSFLYKLFVSIRFYQSWFWMPKYTKLNFFKYSGVGTSTSEFSAVEGSTAPQCIWVTQIWYILFLWSQTQCATERRNVIW